jgi:hypothetical protein
MQSKSETARQTSELVARGFAPKVGLPAVVRQAHHDRRFNGNSPYQPDRGNPRPELWPRRMPLRPAGAVKPLTRTRSLTDGPQTRGPTAQSPRTDEFPALKVLRRKPYPVSSHSPPCQVTHRVSPGPTSGDACAPGWQQTTIEERRPRIAGAPGDGHGAPAGRRS